MFLRSDAVLAPASQWLLLRLSNEAGCMFLQSVAVVALASDGKPVGSIMFCHHLLPIIITIDAKLACSTSGNIVFAREIISALK